MRDLRTREQIESELIDFYEWLFRKNPFVRKKTIIREVNEYLDQFKKIKQ